MNASWNRRARPSACGHTTRHRRPAPARRALHGLTTKDRQRTAATTSASGSDVDPTDHHATDARRAAALLRVGDAVATVTAFAAVVLGTGRRDHASLALVLLAGAIGQWALWSTELWTARVTANRWIELSKLARAAGISGAGVLVVDRLGRLGTSTKRIVVACVAAWVLTLVWRSVHRSWLAHRRREGRSVRRTIVIGTDARAVELIRLFAIHPEVGVRVTGVIGRRHEAQRAGLAELWLGEQRDAARVLSVTQSETIMVCSSDVSPKVLRAAVHTDHGTDRELLFHPGLSGVDVRRVSAAAVANEAFLHVDFGAPSPISRAVKRLIDVVVATAVLLLAIPVLAVVALLIKRTDGGPVLFRQRRVGEDDREFDILKFRTMAVDAEDRLAELQADNQRSGPLFKLGADPRVTPIGNILRRTSLDELPQLLNVLRGEMSLVGPRPALRREVEEFPPELRERHRVRPGITGLWQVEARDNPAFDAYRRLDLFYVRNWTLALDLVIMLGTVEQLLVRPFISRDRGEVHVRAALAAAA